MKRRPQGGPCLFDAEDPPQARPAPPAARPEAAAQPAGQPAVVPVPQWGGSVRVTALTPPEAAQFRAAAIPAPWSGYNLSPAERAAALLPLADRTRWTFRGREVEVRGSSPLLVWFTVPGASDLTQQTVYRHEFLKGAVRCE